MTKSTPPSRTHVHVVVKQLRQRIVDGTWAPGTRIPTKLELRRELKAADGTVQKALAKLAADGFLHSRGRLGTFVQDRPPHLHRFGIVFDLPPGRSLWNTAFAAAADQLAVTEHRSLHCYFDCNRDRDRVSPGLQRLDEDVRCGRLAGLILICLPQALFGSASLQQPGLARVLIGGSDPANSLPGILMPQAYPRAMQYFRRQGRKRLAIITTFNYYKMEIEQLLPCAHDHGLVTQRCWTHYFEPWSSITARAVTELMMSLPARQRPDALYITDDHLVSEATWGVADAGVRVPDEVTVVAHANFPLTQTAHVPVTWLGFDTTALLHTALATLDQQLAGRQPRPLTWVDAVFDFERARQS